MADVTKEQVIIEFDAETGKITNVTQRLKKDMESVADSAKDAGENVSDIEDDLDGVADAAKEAGEAVEDIGEAGKKSGGLLAEAGKSGASAFKLIGAALTGSALFELLKKVLEPILAAFLENKVVADALSAAMAGLGAVINKVVQLGSKLVGVLVDAFKNPQEILGQMQTKVQEFGEKIFEVFSSPSDLLDTLVDKVVGFADTIKNYVTDKITALIDGFGILGSAIGAVFTGDFAGAAELAAEGLTKIYTEANPAYDATMLVVDGVTAVAEGAVEMGKSLVNAAGGLLEAGTAAALHEQELTRLRDAQRDLDVEFAGSLARLEQLKKTRDDERLSIQDRIAAAQEAAAMEKHFTDQRVQLAQETVAALEQEIVLQGATEERLQAVADARIAASDALAASAAVQTELMTSTYALEQEIIAQETEIAGLRREFVTENLEGIDAEKQAVRDQYEDRLRTIDQFKITEDEKEKLRLEARESQTQQLEAIDQAYADERLMAQTELANQLELLEQTEAQRAITEAKRVYAERIAIAGDDEGLIKMATEQLNADLAEIEAQNAEAQRLVRQERNQAIIETAQATISSLSALNEAFGGLSVEQEQARTERELAIQEEGDAMKRYQLELTNYEINKEEDKQAKAQFERGKALEIADATIATSQSAVQAYKSMVGIPVVGPGLAVAAAAAATAAGLAQIASIKQQTYQSQAGNPPTPPPPPSLSTSSDGSLGDGTTGAPQIDLSFLGEGQIFNEPVQAYVLADSVTNAQQANQKIQEQAQL